MGEFNFLEKVYEDKNTVKGAKSPFYKIDSDWEVRLGKCEELLRDIPSNTVDSVLTDPPYGVNINPAWDKGIPPKDIWNECSRILKPGGHCVIFAQPSMSPEFFSILSSTNLEFRDTWIWAYQGTHTKGYKTDSGKFRSRIRNVYNPMHVFRKPFEDTEEENWKTYGTNLLNIAACRQEYKGNHSGIYKRFEETGQAHYQSEVKSNTFGGMKRKAWVPDLEGAEPTNIQYAPRATRAERTINDQIKNFHETVKPLGIMTWLVALTTHEEDQLVVDPFCGSGSTGMACRLLGRSFIGMDKDPESYGLANFRIEKVFELDSDLFKRRPL